MSGIAGQSLLSPATLAERSLIVRWNQHAAYHSVRLSLQLIRRREPGIGVLRAENQRVASGRERIDDRGSLAAGGRADAGAPRRNIAVAVRVRIWVLHHKEEHGRTARVFVADVAQACPDSRAPRAALTPAAAKS